MTYSTIFQLLVFLFSVMIHEISHGVMALQLGDDTAQKAGRLTLNPLKHLDPIGSVLLPLLLVISHSPFVIGWAKPVPYDPRRLKDPKTGAALIALAGPISNIILALIFGMILRLSFFPPAFNSLLAVIVFINILLAVFNIVPIPPLDGSKLLFYFIPDKYFHIQLWLEQWGSMILLAFIFFGFQILTPIIDLIFRVIVGSSVIGL